MTATPEGNRKAAATRKAKDPKAFNKMGRLGGLAVKSENRPFFKNRALAKRAGKISKRV